MTAQHYWQSNVSLPILSVSIELEIRSFHLQIENKQDDNMTIPEISDRECNEPGLSSWASEKNTDHLDNQLEVPHSGQIHHHYILQTRSIL